MKLNKKHTLSLLVGLTIGLGAASSAYSQQSLQDVMKARGLTEKDLLGSQNLYADRRP